MHPLTPHLLTNKSRLPEIYHLRVTAYENSPKAQYVNREIFPNGWFDDLDEKENTLHWIVEDNGKIVAAARIAILHHISETNEDFHRFELPAKRPFAYFSRLVVHHDYRKMGLANLLDNARMDYIYRHSEIKFSIIIATPERHKAILHLGFKLLGETEVNWGKQQQKQTITKFLLQRNEGAR
jgi:predicted GNAT family N-acyltransferase